MTDTRKTTTTDPRKAAALVGESDMLSAPIVTLDNPSAGKTQANPNPEPQHFQLRFHVSPHSSSVTVSASPSPTESGFTSYTDTVHDICYYSIMYDLDAATEYEIDITATDGVQPDAFVQVFVKTS